MEHVIIFITISFYFIQIYILQNIMKKRSFLARGEESLAKLALLARQSDSTSHMVNKRNFIFPHIEPSTNNVSEEEIKTREGNEEELQNKVFLLST